MTRNVFKAALQREEVQYGFWLGLANSYTAEICAGAGFDWLLIDAEHAPNDVRVVLEQLQAIAPYRSQPVVRPVEGNAALLKQLLDIGVQSLLVPMVESAEQARDIVSYTRYPPHGVRGVGTALARASQWNRDKQYFAEANNDVCLLLQVESQKGLDALDEILTVEGVDGVFIGPADLAADLGYLGQPAHPEVKAVIEDALRRIRAAGKAPGILATDQALAAHYVECGALYVAVGVDTVMLASQTQALAATFIADDNGEAAAEATRSNGAY